MHKLPEDPTILDCLDHCLPLVGLHMISSLLYIPIILIFRYRYQDHRLSPTNHVNEHLSSPKKPIEVILLCFYIVGLQTQILGYTLQNHKTPSQSSFLGLICHPVPLCIAGFAVLVCRLEAKLFQEHVVQPYKAILPTLPGWERVRLEKKQQQQQQHHSTRGDSSSGGHSEILEKGIDMLRASKRYAREACIYVADWLFPYTRAPLPSQTPVCFLMRYQMRAFCMASHAAAAMMAMAFSSCEEGMWRWIHGGYAGQPGEFQLRTKWFMGWVLAMAVFLIQTVRILKQSETVGWQEGIKGYTKDTRS